MERSIDQYSDQHNNINYDARMWHNVFSSIAHDLEQIVNDISNGKINVNWYPYLLACDYAGLARMKAIKYGELPQDEYENGLQTAMNMFNKATDLVQKHCVHSAFLWEGFIQFNISRIFELFYERDRKEPLLQGIRDASKKAIDARKRIVEESRRLQGIFSFALTYEYFLALHHEYDLERKWPDYYEGDLNDIANNIQKALNELDVYCNATGLKKLYDMRKELKKLLPVKEDANMKQGQKEQKN